MLTPALDARGETIYAQSVIKLRLALLIVSLFRLQRVGISLEPTSPETGIAQLLPGIQVVVSGIGDAAAVFPAQVECCVAGFESEWQRAVTIDARSDASCFRSAGVQADVGPGNDAAGLDVDGNVLGG